MKTLVTTIITLLTLQANAIVFGDTPDSSIKAVTGYSEPHVSSIELLRAEHGLVVKAEYLLSGCLNEITPVAQTIVKTEQELIVILSALEIQVKDSEKVKCIAANVKEAVVYVPVEGDVLAKYGDSVKVQFAKTNQVFQVMENEF